METVTAVLDAHDKAGFVPDGERAAVPRRHGFRPQLLLADDSRAVRVLTGSLLRRMGCDVDAVEHGEAALGLARQVPYHLILLDLDMPLMDGITTAREIRQRSANIATPMIAISTFSGSIGDPGERRRLFDGEIAKPIGSEQLRRILVDTWPTPSGAEQRAREGFCLLPLADRGVLDAIILRCGRQHSIDAIGAAVGEMRACAGQLDLAIKRNDIEPLKHAAYKLSCNAADCGAARLARQATVLLMLSREAPVTELRKDTNEVLGCIAATIRELTEVVYEN